VVVSSADFDFVCRLVRDRSAISLPSGKEYLVEARLTPVVERAGMASIAELVGRLRTGEPRLRDLVVEAMATHESSFFRDRHPFDALRDEIIPAVLRANGGRRISMWSAAASTGQEAYSLALLMREHFPQVPDVAILASDISAEVLDRARTGTFTQLEVNRGLPAALLVKHFERHGIHWQLKEPILRMVSFRQLNLASDLPPVPAMDIVLLRNVLIYFEPAAKVAVLRQMAKVLRPAGHLFLGAAETTYGLDDSYVRVRVGPSVSYRLRGPEDQP
jgi:chemotaxis protein methyltransferase CheR